MVNVLKSKTYKFRGITAIGGIVATGVVAGGIWLSSLGSTGTEQTAVPFPAFLPVVIDASATGATTSSTKYNSFCVTNPLYATGNSSGSIARATYHNVKNPNARSMDIGFVNSCADKTASGKELFDTTCTGTGCHQHYTTGTLDWAGTGAYHYLKGTVSGTAGTLFDAKVTIWLEDVLGE